VSAGKVLRDFNRDLQAIERQNVFAGRVALSPDGRLLAATSSAQNRVLLLEAATGKLVRRFDAPFGPGTVRTPATGVDSVVFSPDGSMLASCHTDGGPGEDGEGATVRLWEVATGREVQRIPGGVGPGTWLDPLREAAFSPDGRLLAMRASRGGVKLVEVCSGEAVRRWSGHRGPVTGLLFTPDGRRVVSASVDTTAIVWDVFGNVGETGRELSAEQLAALWSDLAGDAARAHDAIEVLAASPGRSVPWLAEQLRQPPVEEALLNRLLAEMDDDDFYVRERATKEMAALGEPAEGALRRALIRSKPGVLRKRVEQLLAALDEPGTRVERLRWLRGLAVLERAGTPEAREVLKGFAAGTPEARRTREAKAVLERLTARR
jgi:hypothetical protein